MDYRKCWQTNLIGIWDRVMLKEDTWNEMCGWGNKWTGLENGKRNETLWKTIRKNEMGRGALGYVSTAVDLDDRGYGQR